MESRSTTPPSSGQIPPEALQEFIAIYEDEFGERLPEAEALAVATDLIEFYMILFPRYRVKSADRDASSHPLT